MVFRWIGPAVIGLVVVVPGEARADLSGDVERLVRAWGERGGWVERLPPVFLEHGRARTLVLAAPREGEPSCTTVGVVGVRTTEFFASREEGAPVERTLEGAPVERTPAGAPVERTLEEAMARRLRSAGGTIVLTACGADREKLKRLRVEMGSPRATIEIVTVRSDDPPRELREILPERAPGPLAPRGDAGGPMEPRPLAERVARAGQRARAAGAVDVDRVTVKALANGAGRFELELAPGCHRMDVMADVPSAVPHRATDVDAEVRDATGKLLARDRSELPDARVDVCVGEITQVVVPFTGAAGVLPVTMSRARWPIPARVPSRWGPRARAAFAATLWKRRAPEPPEAPIFEAIGVQGTTTVPIPIQPGRCYLASLAMVRGDARFLRLSAVIADRVARDETIERPESISVSFCADAETSTRFDVDARGNAIFWSLAVWPMGAFAQ